MVDHFHGFTPTGAPTDDWFPFYDLAGTPGGRTPLLGNISVGLVDESTVAAEIRAADTGGLDFFDVLFYDGGADCGFPEGGDPNLKFCLDTTLAWMLDSTSVWKGVNRLHFFVTYSNDIDGNKFGALAGEAGDKKWTGLLRTFVDSMKHERYLKIAGRPVFNILIPDIFVAEWGANYTLANIRLAQLRAAAKTAGLQDPIIGTGTQSPSVPAGVPSWAKLTKNAGFIRWNQTKVNCPGGCTIKVAPVRSLHECQALCNTTEHCQAITVNRGGGVRSCQLLSVTAPGTGDSTHDTYTRVPGTVSYDWRGTYATLPVCRPPAGSSDWTCPDYKNSWWPNSTHVCGRIFPYKQLNLFQTQSRPNQSHDLVPYVPNLMAGCDSL